MESHPVAGNVLADELWNGIEVMEVLKLAMVPILGLGYGVYFEAPLILILLITGTTTAAIGIAILFAPGSQSSFEYTVATAKFLLTTNTFYRRHARVEHADDMKIRDESLVRQEYEDDISLVVASQQDELLDD